MNNTYDDQRAGFRSDVLELIDGAVTATGASSSASASGKKQGGLAYLNISAVSGTTPSMTVTLETSDNGTDWYPLPGGGFTAATATGKQLLALSNLGLFIRASYVVSGTTPSFTASLRIVA